MTDSNAQTPPTTPPAAGWGQQAPGPAPPSGNVVQTQFPGMGDQAQEEAPVQVVQPEAAANQAPVEAAPAEAPAEAVAPTIQQLIREFAKQPGCERYTADGEKVKLLAQYLWLRQLTPDLSFEKFLELYKLVADFDGDNLKHPDDAIKKHLPRSAKAAGEGKKWSAKEVVDYTALFVDMVRTAEATNTPVPMEFAAFLVAPGLLEMFANGDFKEAAPPKTKGKKQKAPKVSVSAEGQRCIYTATGNHQHRGITTAYWNDEQSGQFYADFKADSGEEFKGVGAATLEVVTDSAPNVPTDQQTDQPLPEQGVGKLTIVKAQFPAVQQALALGQPMGNVAIGDVCYTFNHQFPDGKVAVVDVINGETKPFVDARLCEGTPDNVLAEVEPRDNIEGTYQFVTPNGTYTLEVVGTA